MAAGATWTLKGNTFTDNSAGGSGGGVAVIATDDHDVPHPGCIGRNSFQGNISLQGAGGGVFSSGPAFWAYFDEAGGEVGINGVESGNTYATNVPNDVSGCEPP